MHPSRTAGVALTALALCGYGIGAVAAYPGRWLTIPGVMVGVSLVVMGDGPPGRRGRADRANTGTPTSPAREDRDGGDAP
ncbi:hypothetical protein [Halomarina ordinaria]|uniref:Uncharacterized protein n=1 Tax=Halomarina ordinaria TaxID=3033939 RepID=A0ABD5U739_9EURY|nr:hypothetical protein [Halomarina sp. PSRA2]